MDTITDNNTVNTMTNVNTKVFDVVILGSGLVGSTMAACLVRNGASVLIVDATAHPRFAIGESTIPYTSMLMRLISERYNVPDLKKLVTFENVQSAITTNCGVKKNFGFLYHRAGQPQDPRECHSFVVPRITHTENHFFRQDVDSWMLNVAVKYGASLVQNTPIDDVDTDQEGVTLTAIGGRTFRCKFVVDASGYRSPIARKFALREDPSRLQHHSRSLFTHMIGVTPYEDTVTPKGVHGYPSRSAWSEGTLHHLFEGGWGWIIPFNNHARATNPVVSVGLNLDPRVYPKDDRTPEREFSDFLCRFPNIKRQFKDAQKVRDWVSTGRLQYSSSNTVGYRWCLTSHAAGFVDALFSRGLSNSMEIVNALTYRLLDAIKEDDFSVERFEYVERLEQGLLDFNDNLVSNAYTSFSDFKLWDAWFRVWSVGQILSTFEINRTYARYTENYDKSVLEPLARIAPYGSIIDYEPVRSCLQAVSNSVQSVRNQSETSANSARAIMNMLQAADFVPPAFGLCDAENRWFNAKFHKVIRTLIWSRREAPPQIGELVSDGLLLFLRKRFESGEFDFAEEAKHALASVPVIGAPFRKPPPL